MDGRRTLRHGLIAAGAMALLASFGCERPNPYKVSGEGQVGTDCPPVDDTTANATSGNATATAGPGATATSSSTGEQATTGGAGAGGPGPQLTELDERVLDYSEALRTASLKLVGDLPTLDEVYQLGDAAAADKPAVYESLIDDMLKDSRFAEQMIRFYQKTFKGSDIGNPGVEPSRDTAPVYAARLVVEGQDWRNIVLATSNTCPTWDGTNGVFVDGECNNGITPAGILTDPGLMSLFYGNLALTRNRAVHEIFLCRSANSAGGAEPTANPSKVGPPAAPVVACQDSTECDNDLECINNFCTNDHCGVEAPKNFTQAWPMDSIAGICNGGRVNFHEWNTTVVCANCHGTWNHRAPLWAKFDAQGMHQSTFQVLVPVPGEPVAALSDFLPPDELAKPKPFAWKFSADDSLRVADLAELGQKISEDDEVLACAVKRSYNWVMSRGDIIDRDATVPTTVAAQHLTTFKNNNYDMKATLKALFMHDDFLRF